MCEGLQKLAAERILKKKIYLLFNSKESSSEHKLSLFEGLIVNNCSFFLFVCSSNLRLVLDVIVPVNSSYRLMHNKHAGQ